MVVILANGMFPQHPKPLSLLLEAEQLVCCDGAIMELLQHGISPSAIVGDLDTITPQLRAKYADIIYHNPDQETNDLTKAIHWCAERGISSATIVGATGKREDHTLGNISLLVSYAKLGMDVQMLTDTGAIRPILKSADFKSYAGQQVSFFAPSNSTLVTTHNLKYPLVAQPLPELWRGTLNESLGSTFRLEINEGALIVYQEY